MASWRESGREPVDPPPPSSSAHVKKGISPAANLENRQLPPFDVAVVVSGNKKYQAHKDILEKASPVFELLLKQDFLEAKRTSRQSKWPYHIRLEDVDASVYSIIRSFLYSNRLPSRMMSDLEMTLQVLQVSFQYEINRLREQTIAHLMEQTKKPEAAFKILASATTVECSRLEEYALETIYKNPNQLLTNNDFLFLGCNNVCRILSSDKLSCSEADVFQAAYSWALHQAKEKHSESPSPSHSLKHYFSQVSPCIRFPLMSCEQLAILTAATGDLLPYEETTKLFQHAMLPERFKPAISLNYNSKPRSYQNAQKTVKTTVALSTETKTDDLQLENPPPVETPNPRKRVIVSQGPESTTSLSSGSTAGIPPKVIRRDEDEDSNDDLFTVTIRHKNKKVSTYEDAMERYVFNSKEKNDVSSIILSKLKIENNHKRVMFPKCNEVSIDAKCSFFDSSDASFFNFLSQFNLTRWIVWNTNGELPMTPESIWGLKQDILLKFNGVTFLKVKHAEKEEELVLNYISDSLRIMSNSVFKPTLLAISNSEFSLKVMEDVRDGTNKMEDLKKLVLYRVWGDFTLEEILSHSPNLNEIICWKHVPVNLGASLTLSFSNTFCTKHHIRKLALYETGLKFPSRCSSAATSVQELVLDKCHYIVGKGNANIVDAFQRVFSNLTKLVMLNNKSKQFYERGNVPVGTSALVNCALKKISTLKHIIVSPILWGEEELEDEQLVSFLMQEVKFHGKPKGIRLEKKLEGENWRWSRVENNESELCEDSDDDNCWDDTAEYDCYNLNYFYDSVDTFEGYFKQESNFPKLKLWI